MTTTDTPPIRPMSEILADLDERGMETTLVPVAELGASFKVRGLSRAEVLRISRQTTAKDGATNQALADWLTIEAAVVEPRISKEEYDDFRQHPRATAAINRIQTA